MTSLRYVMKAGPTGTFSPDGTPCDFLGGCPANCLAAAGEVLICECVARLQAACLGADCQRAPCRTRDLKIRAGQRCQRWELQTRYEAVLVHILCRQRAYQAAAPAATVCRLVLWIWRRLQPASGPLWICIWQQPPSHPVWDCTWWRPPSRPVYAAAERRTRRQAVAAWRCCRGRRNCDC